jgi:hypothetical protein
MSANNELLFPLFVLLSDTVEIVVQVTQVSQDCRQAFVSVLHRFEVYDNPRKNDARFCAPFAGVHVIQPQTAATPKPTAHKIAKAVPTLAQRRACSACFLARFRCNLDP